MFCYQLVRSMRPNINPTPSLAFASLANLQAEMPKGGDRTSQNSGGGTGSRRVTKRAAERTSWMEYGVSIGDPAK